MIDAALGALADPTRRRVVELLSQGPHRASALAEAVGASRPAMSRHLRVLREADLCEVGPDPDDGRARAYRLSRRGFIELRDWLDDVERFWEDQLAAFARHLEEG